MAIPKKGSRKITVDHTNYRWAIRRKPSYGQAIAESNLSVAVELYDDPQSKLIVTFPFPRPDNWIKSHNEAVTPGRLAESIRQAKKDGWQPQSRGPAFELNFRQRVS